MIDQIIKNYDFYKQKNFTELKFSYQQFIKAINTLDKKKFQINEIGKSFKDKSLYLIKTGSGKIKVFFWSQMHGNEPISTQGLFDLLGFLNYEDELNFLREKILNECTLYFFPLVNPDGAEKFIRRNAQGIDLNRDAIKQTTPEAKILNDIIDDIKPHFAFNLHDQERYYGTKNSNQPTALSFLSPSFNFEKSIDKYREKSMKLIVAISNLLQKYLPNNIAKYNDDFMPNAFGDNVQAKSISTILFEAGYIIGDENRQKVRKFYFIALLFAVIQISDALFNKYLFSEYQDIPKNIKFKFTDIILKNLSIIQNGKVFVTDVSVIKNVLNSEKFTDLCDEFLIWDIGDLSDKKSFFEINCSNLKINYKLERLQNAKKLLQFVNESLSKG
ncbi:MAG: hypothetical protein JXR68_11640 [Bacteroidales bacterium]|nr:hypothetical protein [Bacteroidales bacterium]